MNPNLCTVVLRPRSPLEVFDLTLLYIRLHAGPLWRLFVVVVLPPTLVLSGLAWLVDGHWAMGFLVLLVAPWLQPPFTVMAGHLLFSDNPGVFGSIGHTLQPIVLFGPLIGAFMAGVVAFVSFGSGLFFWLPMVFFMPESLLLERVGFSRSMKRARLLAAGNILGVLLGTFARLWLMVWCAAVCEMGGQLLVQRGFQLGQPFGSVLTLQVTPYVIFGVFAAQPLHAIYRLLLYIDVRTRIEGWDLQVAFRSAALAREASS